MKAILNISSDPMLLKTRSLVLQSAGYQPVPARTLGDVVQGCKQNDIAAIVVCHAIHAADKERLMLAAWSCCHPTTPIISLYLASPGEAEGADVALAAYDGPEVLLEVLREQLAPASFQRAA